MRTFVGIDPGLNWGWAMIDGNGTKTCGADKFKSLRAFKYQIEQMLGAHETPVVLVCRAMGRMQAVIRKHSAISAIVELVCEERGYEYYEVHDGSIRKTVMGKGNAKKPEVMAFCKLDNEHAADAMLGAMYLRKLIAD